MRVARIVGFLMVGFLAQEARAQSPGSTGVAPPAASVLRPSQWPIGRLGIMAGMSYKKYFAYSAQLGGVYYLTPENRPLSFRVQGYAAWSPFQTTTARAPVSWDANHPWDYMSDVSSGTSREIGGGIAAILHARPKSRVSPYLIVGYGLFQHWQDGSVQSYSPEGQPNGPPTSWPHSYSGGNFSAGVGIRARVGSQVFRMEATSTDNRIALSLGMSLPF
jgi:hypothetical protein